jgi:hypothetical protein
MNIFATPVGKQWPPPMRNFERPIPTETHHTNTPIDGNPIDPREAERNGPGENKPPSNHGRRKKKGQPQSKKPP